MKALPRKLTAVFASAALAVTVALTGCSSHEQSEPEPTTPTATINVTADGWNAETDTLALLQITSEGAEPDFTEYVVVEPNADEMSSVELENGSYDVVVVYPMNKETGEAYVQTSTEPIALTVAEDESPVLTLTLDSKRLLTKEEIEERVAILDGDLELDGFDQEIADMMDAYSKALAAGETTTEEQAAQEEATDANSSSAATTSGSTTQSAPKSTGGSNATSATPAPKAEPAKPAHTHSYTIPITSTKTMYVCCDGASFASEAAASAHESALESSSGTNHSNRHISQQSTQTTTGYKCSCGATK